MTRNIVVTGGGDSVGRALVERYLAEGCAVFTCDIHKDNLDSALTANTRLHGMVADIGEPDSVSAFFDAVDAKFGHVDVLINTVGIGGQRGLVEDIELSEWRSAFSANVDGMLLSMQRVIPAMKRRRSGAIVNFSSASTSTGLPSRTVYIATKYAVEGLTKNAARELGPFNIRCNAVLPGCIDNARMRSIMAAAAKDEGVSLEAFEARFLNYVSMRSKVSPEEIADFIAFITSDRVPHVTGQLLGVDGNLEWEA